MRVPVRCSKLTDALAAGLNCSSKWTAYGLRSVQYSSCISEGWKPNTACSQAFVSLLLCRIPAVNTQASKAVFAARWARKQSWAEKLLRFCSSLVGVFWFSFTTVLRLGVNQVSKAALLTVAALCSWRSCKPRERQTASAKIKKIKIYD